MQNAIKSIPVDEFTSPCPITVQATDPYLRVLSLMKENGFRHLPVLGEQGKVVGVISERNMLLLNPEEDFDKITAQDLMTANPFMVSPTDSLEQVSFELSNRKIGSAIVMQDNELAGIFTTTDALNALVEVLRGQVGAE